MRVLRKSARRVFDPLRTRRVLISCAVWCGLDTLLLALLAPGLEALGVLPPLLVAALYVLNDRRRDVAWVVSLKGCQVVAASLDDSGAHLDVWPAAEEVFVVDEHRRRRTPAQKMATMLRTIAVPEPSPELLLRARSWLDDDKRIDVAIAVRVASGETTVEDVEIRSGDFRHRYRLD